MRGLGLLETHYAMSRSRGKEDERAQVLEVLNAYLQSDPATFDTLRVEAPLAKAKQQEKQRELDRLGADLARQVEKLVGRVP